MSVTTKTAIDAYVDQATPNRNYPDTARLFLNGAGGGNDRHAFIHFARSFPLGAQIVDAKLGFFLSGSWAGSQNLRARRVIGAWAENRLTYATMPPTTDTHLGLIAINAGAEPSAAEVDVTALMQDVANGGAFYGLKLSIDADVGRALYSSDAPNARVRPYLRVEWSVPPDKPSSLTPAGGRAVSVDKPVLSWVFSDRNGGSVQTAMQVQIADDAGFTSILYDSGKLAVDESFWDLAATAYAGLGVDDVVFWRVRVWDDTDLVSPYSDAQTFTRKLKGSVVIDFPADGGVSTDLTPVIAWTFTPGGGGAQKAFQAILYENDADGNPFPIWTSGRVTGTETTSEVGRRAGGAPFVVTGKTYLAQVLVWDEADRTPIYADPDWVGATNAFTYERAGTPAAVTALDASPVAPDSPAVLLEWHRATVPDYFCLVVDGVEVLPRIDPADVDAGGGDYALVFWGGTPRVAHTYEVEAVVFQNDAYEHGDGNATDTLATNPQGIWLADELDDTSVRIDGQARVDLNVGESGATFTLLGSRTPVRITDVVRGYEGSVSDGLLRGKTRRDTFLELKGRLRPLRLVVSDVSIPVVLEEVTVPPTPLDGDRLYGVGFGFAQVADFTFDIAGG